MILAGTRLEMPVSSEIETFPEVEYYQILRSSLAVDAGAALGWSAADKDLSGGSRVLDKGVDMGCFECNLRMGLLVVFR